MLRRQLGRRNITDAQRVRLNLLLKPVIAAKAKAQQGSRSDLCLNSDKGSPPINTNREIAEASGVSRDTVYKVEKVLNEAPKEVQDAMLNGLE